MIPHNPPRTATEGSGTEDTSRVSAAALSAQVVAARVTIEYSLEGENFIYEREGAQGNTSRPNIQPHYYLMR